MLILKETFRSFRFAGYSYFFSLISITIAVFLCAVSYGTFRFSEIAELEIRNRFVVHVFLSDSLSAADSIALTSRFASMGGIDSVSFISKEDAARIFVSETGEDFSQVLDRNPLPESYMLKISAEAWKDSLFRKSVDGLASLPGVSEVGYQADIYELLSSALSSGRQYLFLFTAVLLLISFYIVFTTQRLIVLNRKEEIETMKLIGCSIRVLKYPIYFNGFLTGLFGALLAAGLFALLYNFFLRSLGFDADIVFSMPYWYMPLFAGPCIGFVCSYLSIRKLTLRVSLSEA